MDQIDRCACGSGKAASACCGETQSRQLDLRMVVTVGMILLSAGAITALGLTMPETPAAALVGDVPEPWFYDVANNRHWHAPHGHWHEGPPPPESQRTSSAITPFVASETPASTPLPWQYDAENNRHWHAPHGHWHDGPPPPGEISPNYP